MVVTPPPAASPQPRLVRSMVVTPPPSVFAQQAQAQEDISPDIEDRRAPSPGKSGTWPPPDPIRKYNAQGQGVELHNGVWVPIG